MNEKIQELKKKRAERVCLDCGINIENRYPGAKYCHECAHIRYEESKKKSYEAQKAEKPPHVCLICGCDLSHRHQNTKYCRECAKKKNNESTKMYHRRKKAMK